MRNGQGDNAGMALLLVMIATVIVLGAVTVIMIQVHTAKRASDADLRLQLLDEACKAGIDVGIENIWNQYVVTNGNTTGNLASYRVFINNLVPNNEDLNGNGAQDADEPDLNGNGIFESASPLILIDPSDPYELAAFQGGDQPVLITGLTASRRDDLTGSNLSLTCTAELGPQSHTATQTVRASGAPFSGFEYAVLANNINCIMCHAEFQALDLARNTDPIMYGTFDRIKVATLESLLIRPSTCDSNVAGTLYTRGVITNESGTTLTSGQIAGSDMNGYQFSPVNGKIIQDGSGDMSGASLSPGETDGEGELEQFANLYLNYPDEADQMTDGDLPTDFPAPYGDDNGDRYVNDDEFARVMNSADGSITGGVVYGVEDGQVYSESALPSSSNSAASEVTSGSYDGNLVLVGTDDNPIELNGNIAVDGDLVIKGKVKGWGQLLVRGNAYVVGDVTYADAPGEFGTAADGTENGLALVSGGSVLIGDYLTVRGKNHTEDTSKYPNKSYSIRSRDEHQSSSVWLDGENQTLEYGYFDPGAVDAGGIQETMLDESGNEVTRTGQQFSFTQSELMLFNNLQVDMMVADPDYEARFYGLRETQPDDIYAYSHPPDEHSVRYDESGGGVMSIVDYMIQEGVDPARLSDAAFHYMNPDANWIGEDVLRQIWWDDEQARPSSGQPIQFDGLIYSNNAVFSIARSRVRHGSYTDGKMVIRGAMICPDLGVLAAGDDSNGTESFRLFYDRRVQRFWNLEDTTQVAFRRVAYTKEITTSGGGVDGGDDDDGNNGHGNDEDGEDDSNPGQGG